MRTLTPRGRGGVALVRVSGEGVEAFLAGAFRPQRGSGLPPAGKPSLGRLIDAGGTFVDEVLLVRAGADAFELGCHGGPGVVQRVVEVCRAAGAALSGAGDAERALGDAQTELACRVILAQRTRLPAALESVAAALESDDGRAEALLANLLATARFGLALTRPPQVVLVGPPNAGKSSLMNRLLGHERVIVAAEAGTTRDAIEDMAVLDGVPFRLLDTAGRRAAESAVEAAGIALGEQASTGARCRVLVLDAADLTDAALAVVRETPAPRLLVLNKRDLLGAGGLDACVARLPEPAHAISATTGAGVDALRGALRDALVGDVDEEGPVLVTSAQVAGVEQALAALRVGDRQRAASLLASFPRG